MSGIPTGAPLSYQYVQPAAPSPSHALEAIRESQTYENRPLNPLTVSTSINSATTADALLLPLQNLTMHAPISKNAAARAKRAQRSATVAITRTPGGGIVMHSARQSAGAAHFSQTVPPAGLVVVSPTSPAAKHLAHSSSGATPPNESPSSPPAAATVMVISSGRGGIPLRPSTASQRRMTPDGPGTMVQMNAALTARSVHTAGGLLIGMSMVYPRPTSAAAQTSRAVREHALIPLIRFDAIDFRHIQEDLAGGCCSGSVASKYASRTDPKAFVDDELSKIAASKHAIEEAAKKSKKGDLDALDETERTKELKPYKPIGEVIIANCDINEGTLEQLERLDQLTKLTIRDCPQLTDAMFAKRAPLLRRLTKLDLSNTPVTSQLFTHLEQHTSNLRVLILAGTQITDLLKLPGKGRLNHLDISNCAMIRDAHLAQLVFTKSMVLYTLNISRCSITDAGLLSLVAMRIKHLDAQYIKPVITPASFLPVCFGGHAASTGQITYAGIKKMIARQIKLADEAAAQEKARRQKYGKEAETHDLPELHFETLNFAGLEPRLEPSQLDEFMNLNKIKSNNSGRNTKDNSKLESGAAAAAPLRVVDAGIDHKYDT